MSKHRILITGGGGFIGFHLASKLSEDDANEITLVDNFSRGKMDRELSALCGRPGVRLLSLNLLDDAAYPQLGAGYDDVYHLAALLGVENVLRRPVDVLKVNALMTAKFLDWFVSGGGEKILFSSTSEVYAWTQQFHSIPIPTPEHVPLSLTEICNPRSTYAGSKIFGELAVTHYCAAANKPFVITRYHNVYGPRMGHDHVIPQLYRRAVDGQDPLVVFSAEHLRAFCYVSDAVSATIQAMRSPAGNGETFNIGNDSEEVSMRELAGRILKTAGLDRQIAAETAANDPIRRRCPDVSKARQLLQYEPAMSLDAGLAATIGWYAKDFQEVK